jgi:hypothetical protein
MLGPTLRPGRDARIARTLPEREAPVVATAPTEPPGANAAAPGSPASDSITAAAAAPFDTILDLCCGALAPSLLDMFLRALVGLPVAFKLPRPRSSRLRDHVTSVELGRRGGQSLPFEILKTACCFLQRNPGERDGKLRGVRAAAVEDRRARAFPHPSKSLKVGCIILQSIHLPLLPPSHFFGR